MNISKKSTIPLEILIATMNRDSLAFLDNILANVDISKCHLLIVNQTTSESLLESNLANIRVINSFEKGLSKSRNLGLQNAQGNIVLIADDDLIFEKNFDKIILNAFNDFQDAALITFKTLNKKGETYRNYNSSIRLHSYKSIETIMSVEIALNISKIRSKKLQFDELFGLGSFFETAEEHLFCRGIMKAGLKAYFYNEFIVTHPNSSSGQDVGSDRIVYARAALQYKLHKQIAYIWVPKYLFFLLRHKYIPYTELKQKFNIGLKGIKDYQAFNKNKNL